MQKEKNGFVIGLCRSRFAISLAVLLALAPLPASADGVGSPGEWVQMETTSGCLVYANGYFPDYETKQDYLSKVRIEYQGTGCEPGKLINGHGELSVTWHGGQLTRYNGRITNGIMDGPGGIGYDDMPLVPVQYDRGCETNWMAEGGCVPFTGKAYNMDAAPTAPAAVTSGDGNLFDRCVGFEGPEPSGIQTLYYLRNKCQSKITVSFCLRADFEAAGNDWAMCSNRDYKTYDIRSGERIHFPFSLTPPGTAMSNGVYVDHNTLYVSGAACTDGRSPSVHVENKSLIWEHC